MILTTYFVYVIVSQYFNTTFIPSKQNSVSSNPLIWGFLTSTNPPDKLHCTCKISFHHDNNHTFDETITYSVNNTNVTYILSKSQQQKCGTLIDRGTNGGIADNDTHILNIHPIRKIDI